MTITFEYVDFDNVFGIAEHTNQNGETTLEITSAPSNLYSPSVELVDGEIDIDSHAWRIVHGLSNQAGIDNGIMHPSEVFDPTLLNADRAMHGKDQYYVLTEVVDAEDWDNVVGWIILARK